MGLDLVTTTVGPDTVAGPSTLGRRAFAGFALGGVVAVATGFRHRALAQDASTQGYTVRTTTAVNLRSGAGTTFSILTVVPAGTTLDSTLAVANGFEEVIYNGTRGWIFREYLVQVTSGGTGSRPPATTQFTGKAKVLEAVNFRAGPSTTASIDLTMAAGTVVDTSELTQSGFRAVRLNGLAGWVIAGALVPVGAGGNTPPPSGGQTGFMNTDANFRMDPSYGNNVIRVLPVNTVVTITTERSGDFIRVQTPGDIGWVYAAFVSYGPPPGNGTPPPTGGRAGTVTSALNLRAAASTAAQILAVMPAGSSVTILGAATSGFLPVTYSGLSGWAAETYIRDGSATPGQATFRTTAVLNLRAQPSATSSLLQVVPAGATVAATGTGSAGYLGVSYQGTSGFVLANYLVSI